MNLNPFDAGDIQVLILGDMVVAITDNGARYADAFVAKSLEVRKRNL